MSERDRAREAVRRASAHLAGAQEPAGSWSCDYGGPMFLLPMYVIAARFADHPIEAHRAGEMARYLRGARNADGSFGLYEGGPGSLFTTTLCYVALRLLGEPQDPELARTARWIRGNGTALRVAPWARLALALVDLYDYDGLDPLAPELWLLPYALPIHPGRMWCHARQVYLPMAWLYGHRARRPADALIEDIRDELYGPGYPHIAWRRFRGEGSPADTYRPPTRWWDLARGALSLYEDHRVPALRARALDEAWRHMEYEDASTQFIRIGPVNAVLNTACHAWRVKRGEGDPSLLERSWAQLEQYLWSSERGVSMQGYNSSRLWDTAFALQALRAAGEGADAAARAHGFIRDNQIIEELPDPDRYYRHRARGGWPFSDRLHGWPITDCTAEGLKCALEMERETESPVPEELLRAAVERILSFQNGDGGWSTYERQRAGRWLEALNPSRVFGDIMVDASYPECTSACVQALVKARARFPAMRREIDRAVARGELFLRESQREDGSWEGSWGVCFTYGTWFGVTGLMAAGASPKDAAITRACAFLLAHQRDDGAWGEAPASCWERRYVPTDEGQVVMTSWALFALVRGGCEDREAMARAARFLVERQREDGSYARESIAGVFNRTCMINYDLYRQYFPVWALGAWLRA